MLKIIYANPNEERLLIFFLLINKAFKSVKWQKIYRGLNVENIVVRIFNFLSLSHKAQVVKK